MISEHEIRIHIDEKPYESPNPTTGAALYALGHVASGLDLYREVTGDREDEPIANGPEVIHLKEDEHFHSGPPKVYTDHRERPQEGGLGEDAVLRPGRRTGVQPCAGRAKRAVLRDLSGKARRRTTRAR